MYRDVIKSKDNPKIKLYRKLLGSKKERYKYKQFVLEGGRLIFDALRSEAAVNQIYLAESAEKKFLPELGKVCADNIKINLISDDLVRFISATENTQGIFAQCGFPDNTSVIGKIKVRGRYAVLYRIQDPGNAGMIVRTAEALGLDGVIFCESCDVYNPKAVRASMGSMFRIPIYRDVDADSLFAALSNAGLKSYGAVVDQLACDVKKLDLKNGGAVFIGNEGNGLDQEIIDKCSEKITILMKGNTESLNAAMAAGIIMWELMRCE